MRTSLRTRRPRRALAAVAALGALALTACGGGGNAFSGSSSTSTSSSTAAAGGAGSTLVVGAQGFTEAKIMQQMYVLLLQKAGYTVQTKTAERAVLTKALTSGDVDVVPDYLGSTLNFVANDVNGTKSKIYSSNDAAKEASDFAAIGAKAGIGVLQPAAAQDQNAFYVTTKFAAANGNLTTLSQLAALKKPFKLGADTFCGADTQPYCINGLKSTYGLNLTLDDSYQFGSVKLAQDVVDGKVDIGESGTTDGTLGAKGLVILQDDKKLQPAESLTPFYNLKKAADPKIAAALNTLAPVLTTADLTALNSKVDGERQKPEDVAKAYLQSKQLLG
jgi:osmoprotectant transport system substrate-binding protein